MTLIFLPNFQKQQYIVWTWSIILSIIVIRLTDPHSCALVISHYMYNVNKHMLYSKPFQAKCGIRASSPWNTHIHNNNVRYNIHFLFLGWVSSRCNLVRSLLATSVQSTWAFGSIITIVKVLIHRSFVVPGSGVSVVPFFRTFVTIIKECSSSTHRIILSMTVFGNNKPHPREQWLGLFN